MSAQPEEAPPAGPGRRRQLLAQLRADRRADSWVPAFERDWAKALDDSRHTYSLTRSTTSYAPGSCASPRPGRRRVHGLRP
ncbi:DUF6247 family protein [Streptomyces sp. M10(2022)]